MKTPFSGQFHSAAPQLAEPAAPCWTPSPIAMETIKANRRADTSESGYADAPRRALRGIVLRLLEVAGVTAGAMITIGMTAVLFVWALMEPLA